MLKKKKKWNWAAIIISFILISSTFAITFFGLSSDTSTETVRKYKNYKFTRTQDGWQTDINDKQIFFNYLPSEVETIKVDQSIIDRLRFTPEIDVTLSINDSNADTIALAQLQMEQILADLSLIYLRKGFDTNTSFNFPIITCNESPNVPIIYFKTSLNTSISLYGSCIIAEGESSQDIIRLKDRIIYGIYGIIQ